MQRHRSRLIIALFPVLFFILAATNLNSQDLGHYLQGAAGVDGGSAPPPGVYFTYLPYIYRVDSFKGPSGRTILNFNLTSTIQNAVLSSFVQTKFLGAEYGFSIIVPYVNKRLVADVLPSGGLSSGYAIQT